MGVPPSVLRGKDVVGKLRYDREIQATQAKTQMEQVSLVKEGVALAKELSEVDLQGDNAASRLVNAISQNDSSKMMPELLNITASQGDKEMDEHTK